MLHRAIPRQLALVSKYSRSKTFHFPFIDAQIARLRASSRASSRVKTLLMPIIVACAPHLPVRHAAKVRR
jgi:hypothetical protein